MISGDIANMNDLIAIAERELLYQRRVDLQDLLEQFRPLDLQLEEVLALIAILRPVADRVNADIGRPKKRPPKRPPLKLVP